ncbi:MAG: ESPR-type extended signal peptide-containing protein [Veillonella parvula]|uniref:YadA-like family protein n=1 Tax=Veillonella parvula TaxID=29466 RepID=UPI0028FDFDA2|nr:YadA-like family protein [Veillonella parvula]MDU3206868.1 ESPR-type extended signal peptide-containing protein [Veillonella parvula]
MNRIYNVIWSKTKKCYVVVSEIVKTGGGKVKSVQSGTTWTHMSAIMAVAALLMAGNITTVNAATYTAMTINDVNGAGYATGNVVYSEGSYLYNYQNPGNLTPFDNSHLYNGTDRGNYTENSFAGIAIGKNTNIQETGNPTYYSGLAIGNYAQATGGIAFALGHYAQALSPSAMALGTATKASGFNSLAMMRQSAAEGEFSAALGTAAWAKGNGSFAMGYSATAKADQSIAIGAAETIKLPGQQHGTPSAKYNGDGNTVTEGARSLAFGTKARTAVGADDSMAFGSSSSTGGANAVAMGYSANASAENAFAIGNTAQSSAQNAVAMGKSANASGVSSFAMGSSSNAAGADAIAMGSSSQAKLSNSIALGGNAKSLGADALALGGAANASKDGAIAIGKEAKANNTNTTAIGLGATVTGTNSMAIGTNAVAESNNSLALGTGTEVRGALVNGFSAFTNQQNNNIANGVVAVGNVGSERRIINVAGGENDTDATNVKQLKFVNSNLAKSIAGPTYTGYEANGSTYKAPDFNIKNSTYHTVKEAVEAAQTNFFSAKGTSADANYDNTGATGNNATAAGVRTSAAGNFATAVGADASAANANSTAIGYKAKSSVDDGVALGANSVASVASGKAGYNVKTADSRTNGYSGLTGAALTSTMGAMSVGDGGTKTRQITNVAAGTADTDAVNVAQLRNVNLKVAGNTGNNDVLLDNQTLTVKGDGSYVTTSVNNQTIDVTLTDATKNKIDNAANKDLSNITDGGKSVIRDEAQKAVKVVAGKNTTITEGTDGTYKTYKVDVDAPDYQLVENSSAADKAYTVSGNKVDLTVQDAKNPANKKTVTIKDIASKTELDKAQEDLINKGLKFDADNNDAKTNKLGSKVTVAGDGTNINTTITQTGDDTTIKVALGKDINVNTVTATKTVKAGTATMGNQAVTDNKSATQNGNFVSGLDNKNWTLTDPAFVSGRAATEDQLKIVSDAVKAANAANASASDYRLIANPNNAADGSYKVENNQVDLKVKDEKSSDVKTVTIKDIASKTELDKVKDRSVKYDGNTDKDTVTLEGPNGTKITNLKDGNVAAGSKDAVNGGQLHQVKQDLGDQITNTKNDLINTGLKFDANVGGVKTNKLGSTVTIQGEGTAADADYSGENLKTFIKQDAATGNTTIDVKMNKNLKAESVKVGKNGKDGVSITGPDTANGTDGKVAVTDKNGNEAVSISGKDGVGHIGLTGPAGTNGVNGTNGIDLSVKPGYNDAATGVKGEKGVDGTNGLTRIVYTDGNGEHQVATMEDGLQFTGNNTGTVNKQKLNSLVKVQGEGVTEAESAAFKSASGNINVKADGTDKLELQLAKDLKNLDSVTAAKTVKAGDAIMGGQTVNNAAGDSETGNYVTGLDNKDWDADKIVSGRAATEDQLKKALDAQSANSTDYRLIRNQAAGSNGDYTVDANGDVALTVQDKNHPDQTETVTIKDVASKSKLDKLNDRAVKYDLDPTGNPDKSKVTYEGPAYNNKQGGTHVTNVAYATGNDGSEAVNVDYLNDKIKDSADALTNKGLKFDANQGGEKTNKLGTKVTIKGEGTAADGDYSGENLKTFITQDQTSGDTTINVKMNKNLKAESVKVGKNGKDGVSITGPDTANGTDGKVAVTGKDGKEAVSISGKDGVGHIGLNGKDGRSADISVEKGDPDLNGNEITRIKYTDENGKTHQVATKDDGMAYGGDSGDVIKKKLNTQVNVKGGVTDKSKLSNDDNIGVVSDGTDTLMLRLAKDLKGLNSITFNNGANGVNGKTVVNGEGMTINDKDGNPLTAVTKDGVKITDGPSITKDGVDAAGKKVTNVQDGNVAKDSKDAVNGGQLHDAVENLKSKGFGLEAEDGQSVKKPLGETVKVKGDDTNIKTSVDGGAVKVELKKDITVDTVTANTVTTGDTKMDTNGVTIKDGANEATKLTKDGLQINDGGNKAVTVNKDGLTIENGPKVTKDGIDAADKKITNVADGTIGAGSKDAVNGGQLHTAIEDIKSTGFGLKAEDGNSVKKPLGETIDLKGDGNIKTSVDNGAIKMALNDKITLGQDSAKQVNIDGSAGTITAGNGGNQVKIDGNDGSVTANTVKAGDVVVGKQTSDGKEGNFVTGLDNKTWDPENPVAVPGRAATEDQLKAVNDDFNNKARTGRVFQGDQLGDSGKVVRGLGDTMNLTGGADVNRLADNNIGVVKNAAGDGYNIKLAKDLKGLESVTTTDAAGNTTVMNGGGMTITPAQGNAVSLTKDGLNNGGNRITNVGPGVDGTDAVNVNQLSSAMRSVDGKIADVGATSAAISGLKPLQYDPLEPTQVLAAVGHYKGSTAAAVGVAHYTNESTMFHMGVSLGGHDNMINAGVSYKFGTSDAKKAVPARYKAGPISSAYVLQDEVTALKAENERMKQHDLELTAKYDQVQRDNEEMKAQIALLMQQAGLTK